MPWKPHGTRLLGIAKGGANAPPLSRFCTPLPAKTGHEKSEYSAILLFLISSPLLIFIGAVVTRLGFFALERTLLIDAHAQNSVIFTTNRLAGFSLAHPMFTSSTAFAVQ